jgi:serine/threonine-protein kinase
LSLRALYAIDAFYMAALGTMLGISAYFSPEQRPAVYGAFIWESFMVFSRVLIVPSTTRRTALVTSISFLPLALVAPLSATYQQEYLEMPPAATVVAVWWLVVWAVAIAANGSKVIYGLRRAVSDAMQLGQYTLGAKVDEGGMGVVYRATHALLRRPTAIKLLHPDRIGADTIRRFEREVQLTSQLTHPNTVAIFDYGRSLGGVFYYAMEYLDGIDLETLVARHGPQPPGRVVHILRQICGALDEAHALGLIHRDVKPANILLCLRGRIPDVAKIVDFGLVKELSNSDERTAQPVIAGSPAYIAPEAVTSPELVGPRTDLYGLGAVAYYLLTGQRVFVGKTAIELCVQAASTPAPPPSLRVDRPIPPALEALVLRLLAKDPGERPADARALAAELDLLPDVPAWGEAEALAWWREHGGAGATRGAGETSASAAGTVTVDMRDRAALTDTRDAHGRTDVDGALSSS